MPTRRDLLRHAAIAAPAFAIASRTALSQASAAASHPAPALSLSVRELGALGDGHADDTLALQQTIDRVNLLGGGEVLIPAGDYLTGTLVLRSNITLRLQAGATLHGAPQMSSYPLTQIRWEGRWIKGYSSLITAVDAENITIIGPGAIIGSDKIVGRIERATQYRLPALMEFTNCRNLRVENLNARNFGMWAIHPVYCTNVTFSSVTINSGADGIDVDSCRHVLIDNCSFTTADDCISLKSGRGMEGYTLRRPCEDVRITRCSFSDANFACIGIGSETSGGIRNVHISDCRFLAARTHAIYIKTRPGRGAYIRDITCDNLEVANMQQGFLRINTLNSGKQDEFPVPGNDGIPTVANFRFSNIRVTNVPTLVDAGAIHPSRPLDGLTLANITGTCAHGITLANIRHAALSGIHVTGFTGPPLQTHNVTGTGLAGAAPFDPATIKAYALPEPIPEPASPYHLH